MHHVRSHPRITALALALLLGLVTVAVFAVRSRTAGCSGEAPLPDLPAQLRSLGEFDQPYDATVPQNLEEAALRAASALHPDLAAATSLGAPVDVAALDRGRHDAIVFPLGAGAGGVEGLVVFLRACGDEAYFSTVADLAASPPASFPTLSRDRAARMLGTSDPQLVYTADPLRPRWRDPRTGASVAAT